MASVAVAWVGAVVGGVGENDDSDGVSVGERLVGSIVGSIVGGFVGRGEDGWFVGCGVEGVWDGALDGLRDGVLDGDLDGLRDGVFDGDLDGLRDGTLDGVRDGDLDGDFEVGDLLGTVGDTEGTVGENENGDTVTSPVPAQLPSHAVQVGVGVIVSPNMLVWSFLSITGQSMLYNTWPSLVQYSPYLVRHVVGKYAFACAAEFTGP